MNAVDISRKEKYSRCVALEEDYVHQVYEKIGKDLARAKDPLELTVKKFLDNLEPGSLVADIGCGDGRHLRNQEGVFSLGADRNYLQTSLARQRGQEVLMGDNLKLPIRDNAFDAVLSIGVIHHLTTKERRIKALQELSRILKIGGRVLIAVQRNNTKNSQDVLIPWFDVPKNKKSRDKLLFEQGSDEYEQEDDKDDIDDEDDDEDSISLPSSDEDETPWTNYAKLFPPKSHAKHGWNSERQSRSLDCDYQISSNHVPNTKQLVQTNTCYAFVKKALRRLSSDNSSDKDPHTLYDRVESAVPPSPICGQEQDLLNNSSFNLDETLQKTIRDNFIELLNIDDDQDTSSFISKIDCTSYSFNNPNFKEDISSTKKGTLIRSLSDMFKNMNSLWSTKGTKSCSDLKSHTVGIKDTKSRLVRSRTTATCNNEIDYYKCLEGIKELDMTVSEANKIIDDFLETSLLSVERELCAEGKGLTPLSHSDIVNGNILPFNSGLSPHFSTTHRFDRYHEENEYLNQHPTSEVKVNHTKKDDCCLKSNASFEPYSCHVAKNTLLSCESKYGEFLPQTVSSKLAGLHYLIPEESVYNSSVEDLVSEQEKIKKSNRSEKVSEKYSFLFDDTLDNYELSKLKLNGTATVNKNISIQPHNKTIEMSQTKLKDSVLVDNKNKNLEEKFNTNFSDSSDSDTSLEKQIPISGNENEILFTNIIDNSRSVAKSNENLTDSDSIVSEIETVCGVKQMFPKNISPMHYRCLIHNSPKKLRKLNKNSQMAGSKTLGPFYDEDDDYFCDEDDSTLSSYYSMPELHALSEFYQEYSIYQNYLVNNTTDAEFYPLQEEHYQKTDSIYSDNNHLKDNLLLESETQDTDSVNNEKFSTTSHICNDALQSKFSVQDKKGSACNLIEPELESPNLLLRKFETGYLNPSNKTNIRNANENALSPSVSPKHTSSLRLREENNYKSITSLKAKRKIDQIHNASVTGLSRKISRSQSIGSLQESLNKRNSCKNSILGDVSSSHPSLHFFHGSDSNLIKNKLESNQNCLRDSSFTLGGESKADNLGIHPNIISLDTKNSFSSRAFAKIDEDSNSSESKALEKSEDPSLAVSLDIIPVLKEIVEINPKRRDSLSSDIPSSNVRLPTDNKCSELFQVNSTEFRKSQSATHQKINTASDNFHLGKNIDFDLKEELYFKLCANIERYDSNDYLFDSVQFIDDFYSEKTATKNHPETKLHDFRNGYKMPTKEFLEREKSSLKTVTLSNSTECPKSHFSYEYPADSVTPFSLKNISKTESFGSSHRLRDSVQCKSGFDNGAKSNIKLQTSERSYSSGSPAASANCYIKSVLNVPSDLEESKGFDTSQTIPMSNYTLSTNRDESYDESINYSYGRIQEDGASVVSHRYHHLFEEEELDELIENNISDLHVLSSFHEESHWCIIAEKVRVWTI